MDFSYVYGVLVSAFGKFMFFEDDHNAKICGVRLCICTKPKFLSQKRWHYLQKDEVNDFVNEQGFDDDDDDLLDEHVQIPLVKNEVKSSCFHGQCDEKEEL